MSAKPKPTLPADVERALQEWDSAKLSANQDAQSAGDDLAISLRAECKRAAAAEAEVARLTGIRKAAELLDAQNPENGHDSVEMFRLRLSLIAYKKGLSDE